MKPLNPPPDSSNAPLVVVAVCTHRRNEQLHRLLDALVSNDSESSGGFRIGVAIADDNDDGRAAAVVDAFGERFSGPVSYVHTGSGNISTARNAALDAAIGSGADWVALTDDDCVPPADWIGSLLSAQQATGADIVTGSCFLAPPPGAPSWLSDEPFFESALIHCDDLAPLRIAATNNSLIDGAALRNDRSWRFDPSLGVLGGEDMVFFGSAARNGLNIVYAANASVVGQEPDARATMRYQLRSHLWLGNSEFVTNRRLGDAGRVRWLLRGVKLLLTSVGRPFVRVLRGDAPQLRYAAARSAQALGRMLGAIGVEIRHH